MNTTTTIAETAVTQPRPSDYKWIGRVARALGFAGGGFLSGVVALAYYVAHRITRPTRVTPFDAFTFTPFEVGVPFESVTFPSVDGTALPGWWIYHPDARRVVIICGGYRGHRADMLGIAAALWRDGNNALIFDYRGHGELAGTPVTLGYQEVEDLLSAVTWVKERIPDASIGVIGYSMGGAVAIMGAARSQDVDAVVADSAFAQQRSAVSVAVRRVLRIPHAPLLDVVDFLLGRIGGFHFRDVEPLREVKLVAPRPLLLIHGEADSVTSPRDTRALYEAADEPKELWMTPGVEHCGTYFHDRPYYCSRVAAFFYRALSKAGDEGSSPAIEARSAR